MILFPSFSFVAAAHNKVIPMSVGIQKAWNRFLQELELAKNYHMSYLLNGFGGTFRNPLIDYLLPSLLYVKMVAILNEASISSTNTA